MEDRKHGPEENRTEDSEATPKKRRGGDFLSQYLLRRRESQGDAVEDDEEEETSEKPKKFRRFFKGLFNRVVEPPQLENVEQPKRPGLESLFFGWEDYSNTPASTPEADLDTQEVHVEDIVPTEPGIVPEQTQGATFTPEVPTEIPDNTPDAAAEFTAHQIQETELPPELVPSIDQKTEWQSIAERPEKTVVEKEVVIERGSGLALPVALVGAEYLARKRADRKLEGRVTEKIETIEKDVKQKEVARVQLETLVKQNREQLEILKRGRSATTENQPVQRAEKPELRQEKAPARQEAARPQPDRLRPEVRQADEADRREQYKIMEQVADAAEHNRPVEIAFERSHEVKDDISIPSSAASIGAIMAAQAAEKQRIAQAQVLQRQMGDTTNGLPVFTDSPSKDLYKQAMKSGFWAAMAIIILGFLAYLVK